MGGDASIVVFNAGSSSIKFAVYSLDFRRILSGDVSEIGGKSTVRANGKRESFPVKTHGDAVAFIVKTVEDFGVDFADLKAVAHRVVHGGELFAEVERVDKRVIEGIASLSALAPLHNPHNLHAIEVLYQNFPDLPQFAVFDTGFHRTIDELWNSYALPAEWRAKGYRRYGFHGISMSGLVDEMRRRYSPLPARILAFHLGNGASVTAILDGNSVATSMGFSPLEGLVMGTRTGSIDGNLVLQIVQDIGVEETARLLNKKSGLLGLCGVSDMREIEATDTEASHFAHSVFIERAVQNGASMLPRLGGLDAVVFTGGIGENSANIRAEILKRLSFLGVDFVDSANQEKAEQLHSTQSAVTIDIIAAEEERTMAKMIAALV